MFPGLIISHASGGAQPPKPRDPAEEIRALTRAFATSSRASCGLPDLKVGDVVTRIGGNGEATGPIMVVAELSDATVAAGDPDRYVSGVFHEPVLDVMLMAVDGNDMRVYQMGWSGNLRLVDPDLVAAALDGFDPRANPPPDGVSPRARTNGAEAGSGAPRSPFGVDDLPPEILEKAISALGSDAGGERRSPWTGSDDGKGEA